MPIYDYVCHECEEDQQIYQHITEDALTDCPKCGTPKLERVIKPSKLFYDIGWPRQNESVEGTYRKGKFYAREFGSRAEMRRYYRKHKLVER